MHEIANDTGAGVPVAVTFCPLCNTAMVFDRRVTGRTLSVAVSGKLRASDMVMNDRETESWWQQALGAGIVGEHTGTQLTQLPAVMASRPWPGVSGPAPAPGRWSGCARRAGWMRRDLS